MGHLGFTGHVWVTQWVNHGSYWVQPSMGHILAFLMKTLLMPMTSIIICNGELMKILTKKLLAKKLL